MTIVAHVCKTHDGHWLDPHPLDDHLRKVAQKAKQFAQDFGSSDWAYVAGLWHDMGKYSDDFQKYIREASGYEKQQAHIENGASPQGRHRVDHSTAGALYAMEKLGTRGLVLTYLIAGHHAGLPDFHSTAAGRSALSYRLENKKLLDTIQRESIAEDILHPELPNSRPPLSSNDISCSLWLRLLFSCLVDADFLDTEAYMNPEKQSYRQQKYQSLSALKDRFDVYMKKFHDRTGFVNSIRAQVLEECKSAAPHQPGIFTLTVPTGGGKTLASMAFALEHALHHQKTRIIYVIPYTSITAQTAGIFRDIFDENVIEHHSNVDSDPSSETAAGRLACENWDAPIIVTTTVQFFESLFSNRTSRARKLHNIVNSIVILDEAQLLEIDYLAPILKVIEELAAHYKISFVFSTATQPALEKRKNFPGLEKIQEIIRNPDDLHQKLKRVDIDWRHRHGTIPWESLAKELQQYEQVLCIVNRRDDARDLYQQMPEDTLHLSRNMCGLHLEKNIASIKEKLANHQPIRVISTQLIEAGVDLDFPVVFRAMAGMDSIAQAAGRCNREGKLVTGKVVVFIPPTKVPNFIKKAESTTRELLETFSSSDGLSPQLFKEYFPLYYGVKNNYDKKHILECLKNSSDELSIAFRTAAEKFKLIDENQQATVIVTYADGEDCVNQLRSMGLERWLLRKLQRYTVTIPRSVHQQLLDSGDVEEIFPGLFAQKHPSLYHPHLGFLGLDSRNRDPEDYVCS